MRVTQHHARGLRRDAMRREASTGAAHQPDIGYRCPLALHARDTCSTPFDYASHACNTPLLAFPLFISFFSLFLHSSLGIWKFLKLGNFEIRNLKISILCSIEI